MRVREVMKGIEYEVKTMQGTYSLRETRHGELIVEARARKMEREKLDNRTVALSHPREGRGK